MGPGNNRQSHWVKKKLGMLSGEWGAWLIGSAKKLAQETSSNKVRDQISAIHL